MGFTCGCQVLPGSSVTSEMLQRHLVHTMEALLLWELLGRRNGHSDRLGKLKLSKARLDYMEAVTSVYPEATEPEKG